MSGEPVSLESNQFVSIACMETIITLIVMTYKSKNVTSVQVLPPPHPREFVLKLNVDRKF